MRTNNYKIKARATSLNWKLPTAIISLKLFTYWALTMSDWLVKIS